MGPLCPCPNSKKPMKKGTMGISWGPLLTLGPRAVPEFPNGQSAPDQNVFCYISLVKIIIIIELYFFFQMFLSFFYYFIFSARCDQSNTMLP
ncbi:unnamed protein product [Staurois parvus]|uniref:Uncharacterized protein n=1 Tax=Staurois parvus TaxID=386267 RepID=A0ABN9H186_9NEOB|nr:unnamed protein product [Staurois parvus]